MARERTTIPHNRFALLITPAHKSPIRSKPARLPDLPLALNHPFEPMFGEREEGRRSSYGSIWGANHHNPRIPPYVGVYWPVSSCGGGRQVNWSGVSQTLVEPLFLIPWGSEIPHMFG